MASKIFPPRFAFKVVKLFQKFPLDQKLWDSMLEYYSKFFFLFSVEPATMLVPTIFCDYVWHCHQARHDQYVHDCEKIANRLIDHDDSVSDSVLGTGFEKTKQLWL